MRNRVTPQPTQIKPDFLHVLQSQSKRHLKHIYEAVLLVSVVSLAACGGGGSEGGGTTTSHTVSTSTSTNGAISPASATVNQNATTSFSVTPAAGFQINTVSGCSGTLSGNTYTTGAIAAACTVTASFTVLSGSTFTVGTSAGANGAISPASTTVNQNTTTSFSVTPDAGFQINTVSGCSGSLSGNTFTTGAIAADCTVTASFTALSASTVTVSTSAGANGAISPASATVNQNATTSFSVTPATGFEIDTVSGCSGSLSGNTYTTGAIAAACTVTASFTAVSSDFTVSTSAGPGGSIDPGRTVTSGSTALFRVTPDTGFRYASVSGCSGVDNPGSNNLYLTGPVTANCTITATFEAQIELGAVVAQFPNNGANWNDYVVGDANVASDSPCIAGSLSACLHGGERNKVVVSDRADCTDLTALDSLAAFSWQCSVSSGNAQFISTSLADGKHLSDLLDANIGVPAFKSNSVSVFYQGNKWGQTLNSTWWNNSIEDLSVTGSGPSLGVASRIYLATQRVFDSKYTLDADKVSLVFMPNSGLVGGTPGGQGSYVIESINDDYLWLEGGINAAGHDIGVRLQNVNYSVLRNVSSNNANDGNSANGTNFDIGIYLQGSSHNRLEDVSAGTNVSSGIYLNSSSNNNVLTRVTTDGNLYGVLMSNGSNDNRVTGVVANGNSDTGIFLDNNSTGNILDTVTATANSIGVFLNNGASNNTFSNVTATGNGLGVSLFVVSGNTFDTVDASSNNVSHGVFLVGTSSNTFNSVTANNNASVGVYLNLNVNNSGDDDYSDFNTFTTVAATGNDIGILMFDSSDNAFSGLNITGNTSVNCNVTPPTGTEGGRVAGNAGLDNNCTPTP